MRNFRLPYLHATARITMIQRLPCPFCGNNDAELGFNGDAQAFLFCSCCEAEGPKEGGI